MLKIAWLEQWTSFSLFHIFTIFPECVLSHPSLGLSLIPFSPVWNSMLTFIRSHQFLRVLSLWHRVLYTASFLFETQYRSLPSVKELNSTSHWKNSIFHSPAKMYYSISEICCSIAGLYVSEAAARGVL